MVRGKERRLQRIFAADRKTVMVPMDHGVTIGPIEGLVDMQNIINKLNIGGADACILHKGLAKNVDTRRLGLIVHVSASTKLGLNINRKVKVCSVEEALRLGAGAFIRKPLTLKTIALAVRKELDSKAK